VKVYVACASGVRAMFRLLCTKLITTISGIARICCEEGKTWKLCHGALTGDFRVVCSSCLMTIVLWLM